MKVRLNHQRTNSGIALIIVMLVIMTLGMLAAGLAYSMKVETKLARNASAEPEIELLGLAGVELARYVLAHNCPNEPYDSLDQKWAGGWGGSCSSNGVLADVSLENNELGRGKFSVKVTDLERKVNINYASRPVLEKTMDLLALDLIDSATIVDSIEDWRDRNENPQVNGAESAYYLGLPKPYVAKDGPIDDLSELLLVRGVSPEIYWGPGGSRRMAAPAALTGAVYAAATGTLAGSVGLFDLFNTIGRMQININTASREVLRLLPGIDAGIADAIVDVRDGLDNVDGTEDDTPFHSPSELNLNVPGMNPQLGQQIQQFCGVRSFTFEVYVDAEIDQYKRRLVALVIRTGPRNVQVLNMHWE